MSKVRTIPYRRDIDGLRALAVLLVLIFHFQLSPVGEGGFLGVDVFFVISGFLITSIILKQLNEGSFTFTSFYRKRILRLAPVLFVVLILVTIAGAYIYLPQDFAELGRQIVATQLYFANIYFWQNIDYFGLHADSVPLLHTWSLAVEEQFYLVFPAFLYLVHRFAERYFWLIIALSAAFSFALNVAFVSTKPELTFYLVPTRGWEFLLGSLAVLLVPYAQALHRQWREAAGALGLTVILVSVLMYSKGIIFPGYYALWPCIGAALIILGGSCQSTLVFRLLGSAVAVYIGRLSYSLYLVHWPIHIFAVELLGERYSLLWRLAMLSLTFLVSVGLLHWVEVPMRSGRILDLNRRVYTYYFAGIFLSVAMAASVVLTGGMPLRFADSVVEMAAFTEDKPAPMMHCQFKNKHAYTEADFCTIGSTTQPPKWLIFGDSHAWAARDAFDLWLQDKGEAGLFMFRHACPPLKGASIFGAKGECAQFNANVLRFLEGSPNLTEVVLISTWIYGKTDVVTTHAEILLSAEESYRLFSRSFSDTLDYLNQLGRRAYIWGPAPGAKANVPNTLARADDRASASDRLSYSFEEHLQNHDYFYQVLRNNWAKVHQLFSPAQALCAPTGSCRVLINGKPVYFDGSHLASSLSGWWAEELRRQEQVKPHAFLLDAGE